MKLLAHWADRLMNWLWPASIADHVRAANLLATLEEDRDVWEPDEIPTPRFTAKTNPEFDDLPTIQCKPISFNDDDILAWGDLIYLRGLLSEIADAAICDGYRPKPIPEAWMEENAWATTQLRTLFKDFT